MKGIPVKFHEVQNDDAPQVEITATDAPSHGNAHHEYSVKAGKKSTKISFQNGPIKEFGMNGLSNEALLAIVIHRLECFQTSEFKCMENDQALLNLRRGMWQLQTRTRNRIARNVEGTSTK